MTCQDTKAVRRRDFPDAYLPVKSAGGNQSLIDSCPKSAIQVERFKMQQVAVE